MIVGEFHSIMVDLFKNVSKYRLVRFLSESICNYNRGGKAYDRVSTARVCKKLS